MLESNKSEKVESIRIISELCCFIALPFWMVLNARLYYSKDSSDVKTSWFLLLIHGFLRLLQMQTIEGLKIMNHGTDWPHVSSLKPQTKINKQRISSNNHSSLYKSKNSMAKNHEYFSTFYLTFCYPFLWTSIFLQFFNHSPVTSSPAPPPCPSRVAVGGVLQQVAPAWRFQGSVTGWLQPFGSWKHLVWGRWRLGFCTWRICMGFVGSFRVNMSNLLEATSDEQDTAPKLTEPILSIIFQYGIQ